MSHWIFRIEIPPGWKLCSTSSWYLLSLYTRKKSETGEDFFNWNGVGGGGGRWSLVMESEKQCKWEMKGKKTVVRNTKINSCRVKWLNKKALSEKNIPANWKFPTPTPITFLMVRPYWRTFVTSLFTFRFFSLFIELPLYKKQCIYERFIQWGQTTTGLGPLKVDCLKKKLYIKG